MPSFEKELMFQEIIKEFEKSPYAFISNLQGISVLDISDARRGLEKVSRRSLMVKHAMARKIFAKFNVAGAEKYLNGSVVITFGDKDPQEISKRLVDFAKTNQKWKPAGVIFEGQVHGEDFIKQLAKLPSRKELLTQLVLRMNSPIHGFVNVLGALTRNLVVALEEVRKKKAAAGAAS
ncbi:MAG TPA: 50S ribosomal protein L10 [Candidatus Omnitrophota bacterium]|nr:50S ribosomal protein L10 [Candidatus Omnitrophota bacterium]HPS36197.1 50S ribosomal protein L10 [Candidatus Omnitrophota bacterium]